MAKVKFKPIILIIANTLNSLMQCFGVLYVNNMLFEQFGYSNLDGKQWFLPFLIVSIVYSLEKHGLFNKRENN
jgi:hypothetical protein